MGKQGLSGAGLDFAHSVDPRTRSGLLNAMAMFAGKPTGENAMAAHLGHSEFRPYTVPGLNHEGLFTLGDNVGYGGMKGGGGDLGYTIGNTPAHFKGVHGYTLAELLGLAKSQRIVSPHKIKDIPNTFLHAPYRTNRGLRN